MEKIDPMDIAKESSFATESERKFYYSVLDTFRSYKNDVRMVVEQHMKSLHSLSVDDRRILSDYESHLYCLMQLSEHNQDFLNEVARESEEMFSNVYPEFNRYETLSRSSNYSSSQKVDFFNFDKLKSTLKQIVREWSELGAEERAECYDPIVKAIIGHDKNSKRIYPWITLFNNNLTYADQCTCVRLPDIDTLAFDNPQFTTVAGSFLDVYRESDMWDSVVTCFFIDTANNFVDYIRRIFVILKPGGIWVNLGPLMYHFTGMKDQISVEAPYETVKAAMISIGFIITTEKFNLPTRYLQSPRSMLTYEYRSVFFIATKPATNPQKTKSEDIKRSAA